MKSMPAEIPGTACDGVPALPLSPGRQRIWLPLALCCLLASGAWGADSKPAPKADPKAAPKADPKAAPKADPKAAPKADPKVAEPKAGDPNAAPGPEGGAEAPVRRVVGSVIFPDKKDQVRHSSAQKLLTPEVQKLTQKAIEYVRNSQQADGSWGDKQFPKSSGVTALCCFALYSEGSLPRVGVSGKKLDKAIGFLLSCGKEDGLLVAKDTYKYGPMYDHTWATLALLMAYGNCPWYPDIRTKISRGIQRLLTAQKPDGGWRYTLSPLGASDISVTASVLETLRFARISGFAIDQARIDKGLKFIEMCGVVRNPDDKGTFCYRDGGERGTASTTGAGLLGLYAQGLYKHPYVQPCTEAIAYAYRRAHLEDLTDSPRFRYFHFGCFYASQAMYMAGDEYWYPWYKKFTAVLQATQAENGSFVDRHGNMVYPTAISCVILQAPLAYLPQYLR